MPLDRRCRQKQGEAFDFFLALTLGIFTYDYVILTLRKNYSLQFGMYELTMFNVQVCPVMKNVLTNDMAIRKEVERCSIFEGGAVSFFPGY